ncbi:MAG: nicotinate-nucleotide adenylyltransferase [Coriobacteriaceae bacterium]|nr:nicotinate-nucleotide adenylyltransferase [Coriobacteriaceae bacterium]
MGLSTRLLPPLGADAHKTYRLGIMGGTFDPIHYGHLVTAEQAREALDLDLVLFMPAGSPAFKQDRSVSDAEDRYAMTVLATAANAAFYPSRFEIDRPGVTYTVDTLSALREHYPDNVELYFITGADAIMDILAWHDAQRVASLATLIAATRPGYDIDTARAHIAASGIDFDVRYIEIPALAISSSNIRELVSVGKSVRYLTSESVMGYILKNHLYEPKGECRR